MGKIPTNQEGDNGSWDVLSYTWLDLVSDAPIT